jgi:hypothetical protein
MTQLLRRLALSALVLLATFCHRPAGAEENTAIESRLRKSVEYLASDELEGRGVGTEGLNKAAEYIASALSEAGLKTDLFDGSPFQEFEVVVKEELGPKEQNHLAFVATAAGEGDVAKRVELKLGDSFNTLGIGGTAVVEAPVLFVGYGITAKDAEYDDYADIDVEGKVVLIMRKEPQQKNPHSAFNGTDTSRHALFTTKISNAYSHGAAAVILINDKYGIDEAAKSSRKQWNDAVDEVVQVRGEFIKIEEPSEEQIEKHREKVNELASKIHSLAEKLQGDHDDVLTLHGAGPQTHGKMPVFFARRSAINEVVKAAAGKSLDDLEAQIDEGPKPVSQELSGWKVVCEANVVVKRAMIKNVAGVLEGEGPLADETVIVGAHYDHLGSGGPGSLAPWTKAIHNGADDNASGTAALLEVARSIAAREKKPARRIVFVAFSGEERGLLGSKHYVKNAAIPLEQTVAMVNMDMVGRLKNNKLIVHGTGTAESFNAIIDETNKKYEFDIKKDPGGSGPSDHAEFYRKEIPVFHFFTGTHKDYHRPSDDFDKINVEGMRRVTTMVADVTEQIVASESRPKYLLVKSKVVRRGNRPYLGSIPAFDREVEGYALDGVTKGSPADKAGIKGGDVIVKFGDDKIGGIEDIQNSLLKHKAGDKVKVIVLRDGEEKELTVTLGKPR